MGNIANVPLCFDAVEIKSQFLENSQNKKNSVRKIQMLISHSYLIRPEIRELQRSIKTNDMRYFPQHVLLCTSTVHDQSANICIQGYLRILWIGNAKSSKIVKIHKCYVLCLKLEYFFKSCKT